MDNGEMALGAHVGDDELRMFAVSVLQLVHECLVRGLRKEALLIQQSQYAHRLLDQIDCGLEIEAEIDEIPLNAFLLVFFLLEDEHGVVEELLQLLVGVVDAELLERVHLEDLEAGIGQSYQNSKDNSLDFFS